MIFFLTHFDDEFVGGLGKDGTMALSDSLSGQHGRTHSTAHAILLYLQISF